jgi:FkbM family methyltransferase
VAERLRLSLRARLSWCAHLWKAATQQHHRGYRALFEPLVPRDGVVCDVGAHAGQFAKLFSRLAPTGRVYAFEPGAYARSILTRVVALRRLRNVEICPFGLGDRAEQTTLSVPIKRSGSMGFGLGHIGAEARASASENVSLTTLDVFVRERGLTRLDFIKADIEGWEMRMLAGGAAAIARFRPALMLEILGVHLARAGDTPADVWRFFDALDYRAWHIESRGRSLDTVPADAPGEGDFLWRPRERADRAL